MSETHSFLKSLHISFQNEDSSAQIHVQLLSIQRG